MSQPPVPYDRIFDFETFSTTNPTVQQPGVQIDGELDAVKVTLDSLISRLSEVQRSDGKLNPSAFETTGIPESIASQAYTIVYAQLQPLVLTSAQSASAASASAATAGNHANAAAASASAANAAIAPAVAAKDQAVLKASEAQASAVSANASASTSASAKVESESYRDQALVARDEANQALSSINILKGNIDNRYGNLLDADQNLADVASKGQSVTNLGLNAADDSHRGLYNRVRSIVHMYVDPKTSQWSDVPETTSVDSFLSQRFGIVFNEGTGQFTSVQFGGDRMPGPSWGFSPSRPDEVTIGFNTTLEDRVNGLKNRLSVIGWIFQNTILSQTSNYNVTSYGDNRLVTLYDYATNPHNEYGYWTWSHVYQNVNSAISNHYNNNDVPMDGKQYVRKNRAWLELTGVGGGGGISDYDNFKVYNAGEIVHLSGELYRFNAFIGAAGYGPITHPAAWTKLTASEIADISGLQTALDGKAAASHAHGIGDVTGLQTALNGKAPVSITYNPVFGLNEAQVNAVGSSRAVDFNNAATGSLFYNNVIFDFLASGREVGYEAKILFIEDSLLNPGEVQVSPLGYGVYQCKYAGNGSVSALGITNAFDALIGPGFCTLREGNTEIMDGLASFVGSSGFKFYRPTISVLIGEKFVTLGGLASAIRESIFYSPESQSDPENLIPYESSALTINSAGQIVFGKPWKNSGFLTSATGATLSQTNTFAQLQTFGKGFRFNPAFTPSPASDGQVWYDGSNLFINTTSGGSRRIIAGVNGKVTGTVFSGQAGVNIGIGGTDVSSTVPGDVWIPSGGVSLNFRDATGSWRQCLTTSSAGIIDVSSPSTALRVTQRGTGEAFRVEDSTTPDATPFVINADGKVGVGTTADSVAAIRVDANGIKFGANSVVQAVQAVVTATGTYDKEIPITIDGVNYRIPCRQV